MPNLNEVMQRIRSTKRERKKLKEAFRDGLSQSKPYQDVLEQLKDLKAKKARIEAELRQEYAGELEKSERLAQSLKADMQLLTDLALNKFMKGETVEVVDENETKYEPVFKVTFKKTV